MDIVVRCFKIGMTAIAKRLFSGKKPAQQQLPKKQWRYGLHILQTEAIGLSYSRPSQPVDQQRTIVSLKKLVVYNMEDDITTDKLHRIFSVYGKVLEADIIVSQSGERIGFVQYADPIHSIDAHFSSNKQFKTTNRYRVQFAEYQLKSKQDEQGNIAFSPPLKDFALSPSKEEQQINLLPSSPAVSGKVYISNIAASSDLDSLIKRFEQYGMFYNMEFKGNRITQEGYIVFQDIEDARKAIEALNGIEIDGQAINVDLSDKILKGNVPSLKSQRLKVSNDTRKSIINHYVRLEKKLAIQALKKSSEDELSSCLQRRALLEKDKTRKGRHVP